MKNKEFLEQLLGNINEIAHSKDLFPTIHEHTSKGKLEIESDGLSVIYKSGDFKTNIDGVSVENGNTEESYKELTKLFLYELMYRQGSIEGNCPLIQDLILGGENWKEQIIKSKSEGKCVVYP